MATAETLRQILARIDGKGYKAYKQIVGRYAFDGYELFVDHVQGDPFASPTQIRVRVPRDVAGLPADLTDGAVRSAATRDFIGRSVRGAIRRTAKGRRGTGNSGVIDIDAGGQEILERTAVVLNGRWLEARVQVGLPAAGRSVRADDARAMLCDELPRIVTAGMTWPNLDQQDARLFVDAYENRVSIRDQLDRLGLVAFVADGSILPRESGASDRPLDRKNAVPFRSCTPFRVTLPTPKPVAGGGGGEREITGLGIPKGITLVVGGGYHGKSTLLKALERGVYAHVPGDGREYVVTDPNAVKIRAEDGRRVEGVDISPYICDLPHGRDTAAFSSDDASGSTSQAANIVEAVEAGAEVLLLDEDTSATNFMIRDARMQALVHKEHEPITPFLDRVRELYETHGVSTILVMGGCGDYFEAAHHVIVMRDYLPHDATEDAKRVARENPTARKPEAAAALTAPRARILDPSSFDPSRGRREKKIDAVSLTEIRFGKNAIDLRGVEQLVDKSQTRAVGRAIDFAAGRFMNEEATLRQVIEALEQFFDKEGLDPLDPHYRPGTHPGNFARPRKYEVAAAINRLRTLRVKQK